MGSTTSSEPPNVPSTSAAPTTTSDTTPTTNANTADSFSTSTQNHSTNPNIFSSNAATAPPPLASPFNSHSLTFDIDHLTAENLVDLADSVDADRLCAKANIRVLKKLDGSLAAFKRVVESTMRSKLKALEVLPPAPATLFSGDYKSLSGYHKRLIQDSTDYLLQIAPEVHLSKVLKANLRRLLGLNFQYTLNLPWARMCEKLQRGFKDHLIKLGHELDVFYQDHNLGELLGKYNPVSINHPAERRQFVPLQCQLNAFGGDATVAADYNRECIYIHFLRLLSLALDNPFQQTVRDRLGHAGIGEFTVSSGGTKSYERMVNKMWSYDDHRTLPKPRPAHNIDVVRCLATFETPQDMLQAFEVVQKVFDDDKYANFKNGMAWPEEVAKSRFHLRIVLATGIFSVPRKTTIGELRQDANSQQIWSSYLEQQEVPPSIARGSWKRQATEALKWIQAMPDDTPVSMLCEVQMLLRDYYNVRQGMHELYKIVRADNCTSLAQDFDRHKRASDLREKFAVDGDTDLKASCRDGDSTHLPQLLSDTTSADHVEGLCLACEYVRPRCVELLLQHVKSPVDLGKALYFAAKGTGSRASFQLDSERRRIVERLADAKADLNTLAVGFKETETYAATAATVAAENGHVDTMSALITAKVDVDAATHQGWTPTYMAAFNGHTDCISALISAKANVDKNENGTTPTFIASQNGHFDCLSLLIAAKAHLHERRDGQTPIGMALHSGHSDCVSLLLSAKVDANSFWVGTEYRLIHHAAENGHYDCLSTLISAEADVNMKAQHQTALSLAKKYAHEACVELLVAAGAVE